MSLSPCTTCHYHLVLRVTITLYYMSLSLCTTCHYHLVLRVTITLYYVSLSPCTTCHYVYLSSKPDLSSSHQSPSPKVQRTHSKNRKSKFSELTVDVGSRPNCAVSHGNLHDDRNHFHLKVKHYVSSQSMQKI